MKTKKLLTFIAISVIALIMLVTCKKDDFKEVIGTCPQPKVEFTVTLSSNPILGGITIGNGTFPKDTLVTVTATPNAGYTFTNWTNGAAIASISPIYTFPLIKNTVLVANFTPVVVVKYTVTLSSKPIVGGTTTGAGQFLAGSSVTVAATPNVGYTFVNWTKGAVIASTSSSYTFTLIKDTAFIANFTPVVIGNHAVVLTSNPIAGGTTTGAGQFLAGSSVTIGATPNIGYTFVNWTKGATIISTTPSYTFTLTKDTAFVANFLINKYTLNVTAVNGIVVKNPNQPTYNSGDVVQLTATPAIGYIFDSWSGDVSGLINPISITMNSNKNVTANFILAPITYTLNVTAVNGTVVKNPNQPTYNNGASVTLTPTPALGYVFSSWSGDASGNNNPLTVLMNGNKNITANFTLIPATFTLNVTAVNGSVVKNPNQPTYNNGDVVQLTATPAIGYQFDSWSGDATGIVNPTSVTMNANKNVTANFSLILVVCPTIIDLGLSGNFAIFAESGISTTGVTLITGDIGVNPITSTGITGFGLILPAGSAYSTSTLVVGKVYAPDYAVPTPANMVTTTGNMETAYTTANGLVVPAPTTEFMAGNLNGQTLTKGIYKWSSGVSITNGITLDGGGDNCATFIFQIAGDLTVANSAIITLTNGAQAKNIFWVVAGSGAVLGTNVDFSGNILCKTLISVNTGGKVTGRLLAQTAVTLNKATIIKP